MSSIFTIVALFSSNAKNLLINSLWSNFWNLLRLIWIMRTNWCGQKWIKTYSFLWFHKCWSENAKHKSLIKCKYLFGILNETFNYFSRQCFCLQPTTTLYENIFGYIPFFFSLQRKGVKYFNVVYKCVASLAPEVPRPLMASCQTSELTLTPLQ